MGILKGVLSRLPVKGPDGMIELIEIDSIFYLEAKEGDTIIRTKRKKLYHSVERLSALEKKLPQPPFVRCHREYVVNLNRVRAMAARSDRDDDLRLDPPVNRRIPIARDRLPTIRQILGL